MCNESRPSFRGSLLTLMRYEKIEVLLEEETDILLDQQTSIDTGRPRSTQTSPGQRAEMDHSKTQILLQLARWMADTGQGAASDITGVVSPCQPLLDLLTC